MSPTFFPTFLHWWSPQGPRPSHICIPRVQDSVQLTVGTQRMFVDSIKRGRQWGKLREDKRRHCHPQEAPQKRCIFSLTCHLLRWAKARSWGHYPGLQKEQGFINSLSHSSLSKYNSYKVPTTVVPPCSWGYVPTPPWLKLPIVPNPI